MAKGSTHLGTALLVPRKGKSGLRSLDDERDGRRPVPHRVDHRLNSTRRGEPTALLSRRDEDLDRGGGGHLDVLDQLVCRRGSHEGTENARPHRLCTAFLPLRQHTQRLTARALDRLHGEVLSDRLHSSLWNAILERQRLPNV